MDISDLEKNCEYGGLSDHHYCGYLTYWESIECWLCNHKKVPTALGGNRGARDCRDTIENPCIYKITKDKITKDGNGN